VFTIPLPFDRMENYYYLMSEVMYSDSTNRW